MNCHAPFTHLQTKAAALSTASTPPNPIQQVPKTRLCGTLSNMQLGMSAWAMPKRGAQSDVFSSKTFLGLGGLNSTNSTTITRFKLSYRLTAKCLLPGSLTFGWYLGVVVLDAVRGECVLD
jgi:hypothetical protein